MDRRVLTNSTEQVVFKKLTVAQLVKIFPTVYGTVVFITVLKRLHHGPYPKRDESRATTLIDISSDAILPFGSYKLSSLFTLSY